MNSYLDDLAVMNFSEKKKDVFMLVENDDCYAYLANDDTNHYALSIFTDSKIRTYAIDINMQDLYLDDAVV